jgi:hypothetical protein
MKTDQPYPDMTDSKALGRLLSISISLMDVKKPIVVTQAGEWGDILYDIYKFLVDRLGDPEEAMAPEILEGSDLETEIPVPVKGAPGERQAVNVFHIEHVEHFNIKTSTG